MQRLEVSGAVRHTHTHTHTHIYIYIYIYVVRRQRVNDGDKVCVPSSEYDMSRGCYKPV
jgi:hypothetical protein